MKNTILFIGGIILLSNLLLGMILSAYPIFNVGLNSVVIIVNTVLLYAVNVIQLKDAFKIFFSLFLPIIGVIEFILGLFANSQFKDNWFLVFIVFALMGEAILLVVIKKVSQINS
ncbi:putative membrane protein [Parabacteroides sp. PFB2-12]|uniref:hypothetical protein n=1 Tax=unclassified Parabacteroides TaxID=2649774 RepID=UPI0024734889|nr:MULTISPECIES: hypothetical protein [unclassified Parabacteroides]MDH6343436.1 putative membrane protein [Parabacteroides sp. PM6-13]MDH6391972.1 putative membrane protein [Parabacteroides sp. PFB2-12]